MLGNGVKTNCNEKEIPKKNKARRRRQRINTDNRSSGNDTQRNILNNSTAVDKCNHRENEDNTTKIDDEKLQQERQKSVPCSDHCISTDANKCKEEKNNITFKSNQKTGATTTIKREYQCLDCDKKHKKWSRCFDHMQECCPQKIKDYESSSNQVIEKCVVVIESPSLVTGVATSSSTMNRSNVCNSKNHGNGNGDDFTMNSTPPLDTDNSKLPKTQTKSKREYWCLKCSQKYKKWARCFEHMQQCCPGQAQEKKSSTLLMGKCVMIIQDGLSSEIHSNSDTPALSSSDTDTVGKLNIGDAVDDRTTSRQGSTSQVKNAQVDIENFRQNNSSKSIACLQNYILDQERAKMESNVYIQQLKDALSKSEATLKRCKAELKATHRAVSSKDKQISSLVIDLERAVMIKDKKEKLLDERGMNARKLEAKIKNYKKEERSLRDAVSSRDSQIRALQKDLERVGRLKDDRQAELDRLNNRNNGRDERGKLNLNMLQSQAKLSSELYRAEEASRQALILQSEMEKLQSNLIRREAELEEEQEESLRVKEDKALLCRKVDRLEQELHAARSANNLQNEQILHLEMNYAALQAKKKREDPDLVELRAMLQNIEAKYKLLESQLERSNKRAVQAKADALNFKKDAKMEKLKREALQKQIERINVTKLPVKATKIPENPSLSDFIPSSSSSLSIEGQNKPVANVTRILKRTDTDSTGESLPVLDKQPDLTKSEFPSLQELLPQIESEGKEQTNDPVADVLGLFDYSRKYYQPIDQTTSMQQAGSLMMTSMPEAKIAATLDLHGYYSKEDAISSMTAFLSKVVRDHGGKEGVSVYVTIITGSGSHSVDGPILRQAVQATLDKRQMAYFLNKGKGSFTVDANSGYELYGERPRSCSKIQVIPQNEKTWPAQIISPNQTHFPTEQTSAIATASLLRRDELDLVISAYATDEVDIEVHNDLSTATITRYLSLPIETTDEDGDENDSPADGIRIELVLVTSEEYLLSDEGKIKVEATLVPQDTYRTNVDGIDLNKLAVDSLPKLVASCRMEAASNAGGEAIFAVLSTAESWLRYEWTQIVRKEAAAVKNYHAESVPVKCTNATDSEEKEYSFCRMLLHTHHIIDPKKVRAVKNLASACQVGGYIKTGTPAFILIEGLQENCQTFTYDAMQQREKKSSGNIGKVAILGKNTSLVKGNSGFQNVISFPLKLEEIESANAARFESICGEAGLGKHIYGYSN